MGKYNQSIGFRLTQLFFSVMMLVSANSALAFSPENGWWWNPQESGRGFNLEIQNNTIFVATFIYDNTGDAVWYSGSGTLNADNTATLDLFEFANGQCVQCSFKTPDLIGTAETVTIRFLTGSTAELDWSNGTVAIQRFNFNLGESWQKQLLGEWVFVSGTSVLPIYTGDRITFDGLEQTDTLIVKGHRSGNGNAKISVFDAVESNNSIRGFTRSGLMLTNTSTLRAYAFDFSGLNKIEGITADVATDATEQEITQALTNQGVEFIGFRIK